MNRTIEILSTLLSQFEVIEWDNRPLFNNYQRLRSYIAGNLGQEHLHIFSIPQASKSQEGKPVVAWHTYELGENPVRLSDLEGKEYTKYAQILEQSLKVYIDFVQSIEEKGKEKSWAELLKQAIVFGGEEFVFTGNDKVVLAAWAMKPKGEIDDSSLVGIKKAKHVASRDDINETSVYKKRGGEITESDTQDTLSKEESFSDTDLYNDTNHGATPIQEEVPLETLFNEDSFTPDAEISSENEGANPAIGKRNRSQNLKYLTSLLLFLLLLVLGFLLVSLCREKQAIMPNNPGEIVPVDSSKIELDQDSVVFIVNDRINILLKGGNTDIHSFAKEFKEEYPSDLYEILYYDTLLNRIQIQVPAEEKEKIKTDLPQVLEEFEMIIWDESIYKGTLIPNDPGFLDQKKRWHLDAIEAAEAWNIGFGNKDVVVAVLDNGFDLTHPELKKRIFKPYNVTERNTHVFTNSSATHGTHVAGLSIGAEDNNLGISGIAPACKFMPIQVSDRNEIMSFTAIIDGVVYAITQGADVINLSLGMAFGPSMKFIPQGVQRDLIQTLFQSEEKLWNEIFKLAIEQNVTLILAAGNEDIMVGIDPMQRNAAGIKVNAVTPSLTKASFSNYGDYSTVSAPGVQIYSSLPFSKFGYQDGTSMAAPIVAGAVALLKSLDENLSSEEIKDILVKTGRPIPGLSKPVGPLIQLGKAIEAVQTGEELPLMPPTEICEQVQLQIDSLLAEVERLRIQCPVAKIEQDTMKMPEEIEDVAFMEGRWKSTTSIHNNSGEQVVIYFDFKKDETGKITLVEPNNTQCFSSLTLFPRSSFVEIDQDQNALCNPPPKGYNAYNFTCKADAFGYAECTAQNQAVRANRFTFNLIKIK